MTRVAYIGNFRVPWCTEVHMARALREVGCDVLEVQQDSADERPMSTFFDTDLVLYTRTHNASALDDRWSQVWDGCAHRGIVTASFHLDRFWDLERERLVHDGDALFTVAHCFTADGGNAHRWDAAGVNHHWLPPGVDRMEAELPGRYDRSLVHDVVFVGSGGYHAEYPQRDALLAFLSARYGSRFAHYGHGGGRPVVRGQALNDVLASARVVVGDSCFANASDWRTKGDRYWSDRVPETLGRGGRLVHAWNDALFVAAFPVVMHIPGDFDSLAACVDVMLDDCGHYGREHDDAMRAGARAFILANHTYTHRARTLLETVGLLDPVESAA